jgi:hypothetical protein
MRTPYRPMANAPTFHDSGTTNEKQSQIQAHEERVQYVLHRVKRRKGDGARVSDTKTPRPR